MTRLLYSLARTESGEDTPDPSSRPLAEDATISITMAALGLPLVHRQFVRSTEGLMVVLSFSDDAAMNIFNLRIERALARRAMHITKISVVEESVPQRERAAA